MKHSADGMMQAKEEIFGESPLGFSMAKSLLASEGSATGSEMDITKFLLNHWHRGPGWAVVEQLPKPHDDMVRVVMVGKDDLGTQAFLAWKKLLSIWTMPKDPSIPNSPHIPVSPSPLAMEKLAKLRDDIRAGTKRIVGTHIVQAGRHETTQATRATGSAIH